MAKKVIAVDIDDVLSPQHRTMIEHSNRVHGTSITFQDFLVPGEYWHYWESVWIRQGFTKEQATEMFDFFCNQRVFLEQHIPDATIDILSKIKQDFRLEIITSRNFDWHEDTVGWINHHAPDIFDEVHFVDKWNRNLKTGEEKVEKAHVCKRIGASYLIDDNVNHCNLASKAGVDALLFGNFGWNVDATLEPGVTRVDDWPAVVRAIYNE